MDSIIITFVFHVTASWYIFTQHLYFIFLSVFLFCTHLSFTFNYIFTIHRVINCTLNTNCKKVKCPKAIQSFSRERNIKKENEMKRISLKKVGPFVPRKFFYLFFVLYSLIFFLDGWPNDQLLTINWQISWLPAP